MRGGGAPLSRLTGILRSRDGYEANWFDRQRMLPRAERAAGNRAVVRCGFHMRGGEYTRPRPFELAGDRQPDHLEQYQERAGQAIWLRPRQPWRNFWSGRSLQ